MVLSHSISQGNTIKSYDLASNRPPRYHFIRCLPCVSGDRTKTSKNLFPLRPDLRLPNHPQAPCLSGRSGRSFAGSPVSGVIRAAEEGPHGGGLAPAHLLGALEATTSTCRWNNMKQIWLLVLCFTARKRREGLLAMKMVAVRRSFVPKRDRVTGVFSTSVTASDSSCLKNRPFSGRC